MSIIAKIAAGLPAFLDRRFAGHRDPIVAGDRLAASRAMWPEGQWPTLYRDIPADIRRPVVWDGRLLGGQSVTWLAWRHFSPELVSDLAERSGYAARRASFILFAAMIALIVWSLWDQDGGAYPVWASQAGAFMPIAAYYVRETLTILANALNSVVYAALAALLAFPAFWVFGFWRGLKGWWQEASDPLTVPTRDALLIWKSRADIRPAEYRAYCRQVQDATTRLADMPLIAVGKATGTLRARGDMEAPNAGQTVAFDGESIRQHVLILGGTGVGKTRLAVRPLFERIMTANWGAGHKTGAYVTDGKGTLWRDVLPSVSGRDDVVVVGTGIDHHGVDLLAGMTPLEVATTFKAVSGQVAGKPADDFWPESASGRLMHAAAIALVLDNDEASRAAWGDTLRPYSLMGIAKLASDDEVQKKACARIRELSGLDPSERPKAVAPFLAEAVESADWVEGTWFPMAQETRSGIVANINVVLGKLSGAGPLADRFFRGTFPVTTDVDHALNGGILMIAVGETEWGLAGKVVNVWLKTRLYVAARKRLVNDPEACRRTSCALFADEFQMLVTAGPDSDTTFWNVARETGVFLVAATQSIAALHQVLGHEQTANVVNLLRSKIVLKTEEASTIDYVRKLAGESPRGWESEPEFFSSQGARELAFPDRTPATPGVSWLSTVLPAFPRLSTRTMRQAVVEDMRFVLSGGGQQAAAQRISSEQQATWRAEDKSKDSLTSGLQWRPKLESDELLLGSGFAFAIIQRAGGDRSDLIDLAA